jgi:hypothetical protein
VYVAKKAIFFTELFIVNEAFRDLFLSVIWYLRFSTPRIRIAGLPSVYPYPVIYTMHRKLAILDV